MRAGFETTFQTLIALLRLCPGQLEQAMSGHALPVVHVESQPMALLDHPVPVDIGWERHRCRDWRRGYLRPKLPSPDAVNLVHEEPRSPRHHLPHAGPAEIAGLAWERRQDNLVWDPGAVVGLVLHTAIRGFERLFQSRERRIRRASQLLVALPHHRERVVVEAEPDV